MIGYVTLGSNDIPRAAAFYDALLAAQGAKRIIEDEHFIAWSPSPITNHAAIVNLTRRQLLDRRNPRTL